jgi:hypothetical protein
MEQLNEKVRENKKFFSLTHGNDRKRKRRAATMTWMRLGKQKELEAALYLLLPLQGLGSVLGAEAVGPLGGLQVEEALLVGFLGRAGQGAALTHTTHLPRDRTGLKKKNKENHQMKPVLRNT